MRLLADIVYAYIDADADIYSLANLHANTNQHTYCNPDANCNAGSL